MFAFKIKIFTFFMSAFLNPLHTDHPSYANLNFSTICGCVCFWGREHKFWELLAIVLEFPVFAREHVILRGLVTTSFLFFLDSAMVLE